MNISALTRKLRINLARGMSWGTDNPGFADLSHFIFVLFCIEIEFAMQTVAC